MYEAFYNLTAEPFRLSPDHKFCYEHKGYAKARAYMAYAFTQEEGFVMITGRPGTGKTTLVGALVESLASDNVQTANLVCTQLAAGDLLRSVAYMENREYIMRNTPGAWNLLRTMPASGAHDAGRRLMAACGLP